MIAEKHYRYMQSLKTVIYQRSVCFICFKIMTLICFKTYLSKIKHLPSYM